MSGIHFAKSERLSYQVHETEHVEELFLLCHTISILIKAQPGHNKDDFVVHFS